MVRYAVAKGLRVPMRVLYSSKDRANTTYQRELARLTRRCSWLEVSHVFTGDPSDPAARYHRRIDQRVLGEVFAGFADDCLAYVCGPFRFVDDVEAVLATIGVGAGRLMSDSWE